MSDFLHQPIMLDEVIRLLQVKPDGIYVDATVGGAGHASRVARELSQDGLLIGLDQDENALVAAAQRLTGVTPRVELRRRNFAEMGEVFRELRIEGIDGILFDLGVSSPQFDEGERGFSYRMDAPLDMRMDQRQTLSAKELVNTASVGELTRIFREYGEERFSPRIARKIAERRSQRPIETTGELAELIKEGIPAPARRTGPHPARRVFQALRIAVNRELEVLPAGLKQAVSALKPGGRLAVITFHSLEDRLVKTMFADWAKECHCPPGLPVCSCGTIPTLRLITRKPVAPTEKETEENPRARSAKLRVAEKI